MKKLCKPSLSLPKTRSDIHFLQISKPLITSVVCFCPNLFLTGRIAKKTLDISVNLPYNSSVDFYKIKRQHAVVN